MPDRDDWDQHWAAYAATARLNPAQRYRRRLIVSLLRDGREPLRILDIGSGTGELAHDLQVAFPGAELMGIELSETAVRIARARAPAATFLQLDLLRKPDPRPDLRGWATHAVCSEVLEHLDEPSRFLANAAAYLAPGARLVVTVPAGPMSAFDRHIGHRRHFTPSTLREALDEADFLVETVSGAGFPFFNLYRLLVVLRGKRLVDDAARGANGCVPVLGRLTARVFDGLLRLSLNRSSLGWQIVACSRAK
jgi:SAM-dependent methyltransferase